ncbi:MAG: dTDP-glucose 4,6-dehydratase [Armatimonadota bacterium]|nr:dTDP-glucose 4,6-dehydratase [Armatimonadota bacterium]
MTRPASAAEYRAGAPPGLRLLVTGGMGFIGSNFVRHALRTRPGWRIVNLDKLTYAGNPANLADLERTPEGERHRFVRGDIGDATLVGRLFDEGLDAVVNFAAESHVDRSILDAAPFLRTNVAGTQTLLDAARRAGLWRFVQVSSDEVYGPAPDGAAFTEDARLQPTSPYAASKAAADLLCQAYHRTYGLPVIISRCTNNYGPYQYPEKFIPLVIIRALDGEPIPLYGDGRQIRDWLHVADHCEAICRVLESGTPGEVYNVAAGTSLTNRELAERVLRLVGRPVSLVRQVEDRPAHDRRYALDAGKIRATLGFAPARALDEGLADTVRWYVDHEAWWRPITSGEFRRFYDAWYAQRR